MKIEFENDAKYITARYDSGTVAVRCKSDGTDIRDDEPLDSFVARHGGPEACARALAEFNRAA